MSTMLGKFKTRAVRWHETHSLYYYRGRAHVYGYLISHYGIDRVRRHKQIIEMTLNNAEGVCPLR